MALPILDGNQSATTLSSILTSGEHIPAHTVVSLGTQAITDISGAVSGSVVSISNFPATQPVSIASVTIGNTVTIAGTVTANPTGTQTIAGTVKVDGAFLASGVTVFPSLLLWNDNALDQYEEVSSVKPLPISGTVTIGNTVTIAGTVTANPTGTQTIAGTVTANLAPQANGPIIEIDSPIPNDPKYATIVGGFDTGAGDTRALRLGSSGGIIVQELPAISGTVTANVAGNLNGTIENYDTDGTATHKVAVQIYDPNGQALGGGAPLPISGTVTANGGDFSAIVGESMPAKAVAIGFYSGDDAGIAQVNDSNRKMPISGTVTLGAGTAQIGSVTANIGLNLVGPSVRADSGFSLSTRGMMVVGGISTSDVGSDNEYRELKITSTGEALVRGTVTVGNSVTIGSLPAISGTVTANLSISSTVITSGSFSSLSSATLVPENPARKMATVFNLGAGQLFINAGVTATTLGGGFMVALSSGDFYECDYTTTTLSAIFATAGTASWMSH